jgi:thioredoxin reductase
MTEAILASEPLLADALEAGVDVRLGTVVWGLYANGPSVGWLPGRVAGLSDGDASWMLGFQSAIVATGRRDMGLAFPGWALPGVMGATAAERLARYGALAAQRAIVLGTSAEALLAALALHRAGVEIVAVVEQAVTPIGPDALLAEVAQAGIALLTRHVVASAEGHAGSVTGAVLVALDEAGRRVPGSQTQIACDTIVLGVGTVPVIELLDAIGCRSGFVSDRGGHVPVTDEFQRTSVPGIYAVGDCAGVWAAKSADRAVAEAEGLQAANHIAGHLGNPLPLPPVSASTADYRLAWVRSTVVDGAPLEEPHVCQCESVTARDILEVRPPRYLNWERPLRNSADLAALLGNGPPNPDQVKRLTRAGMGLCQGRRCREQVAALLALGTGTPLAEVPLATHRAPVRPISLGLAGSLPESAEMAEHWELWFGIPGQVTSYWDIKP